MSRPTSEEIAWEREGRKVDALERIADALERIIRIIESFNKRFFRGGK